MPTMGAVTCGFASTHATAICAMLTPFFFASSSTLEPTEGVVSLGESLLKFLCAYITTRSRATYRDTTFAVASVLYCPMNLSPPRCR